MENNSTENKEMRITRLEKEIKEAKDQLLKVILNGDSNEKIINVQAYIRYLENKKQEISH